MEKYKYFITFHISVVKF